MTYDSKKNIYIYIIYISLDFRIFGRLHMELSIPPLSRAALKGDTLSHLAAKSLENAQNLRVFAGLATGGAIEG